VHHLEAVIVLPLFHEIFIPVLFSLSTPNHENGVIVFLFLEHKEI